jgi:hypothetical protein
MNHFTLPAFWECYRSLPDDVKRLADKNFALLKENSAHPSLHFKRVGNLFSARVGLNYRAIATEHEDGLLWFWIGKHSDYERIIRG